MTKSVQQRRYYWCVGRAQPDRTGCGGHAVRVPSCKSIGTVQDLASLAYDICPVSGQTHASATANKQSLTQQSFDAAELRAQCGLGEAE